jgi:hypothetical protein
VQPAIVHHFGFICDGQDLTARENDAVYDLMTTPLIARHRRVINAAVKSDLDAVRTLHTFPFKLSNEGVEYHGALSLCGKRTCLALFSADLSKAIDVKVVTYQAYSEVRINATGLVVDEEKEETADLLELVVSHVCKSGDNYTPTALATSNETGEKNANINGWVRKPHVSSGSATRHLLSEVNAERPHDIECGQLFSSCPYGNSTHLRHC